MTSTTIGKHLIAARINRGLTQRQLAESCQLHQSVISAIENGKRWPSVPQLTQLALVLQVPLQAFLTGTDVPGTELADIAIPLQRMGIADLHVPNVRVNGAFPEQEEVIALALRGNTPVPQIVEAMPAVLAWVPMDRDALHWFADRHDSRIRYRIAWLADIALTIDRGTGFPGGCVTFPNLENVIDMEPPAHEDTFGFAETAPRMSVSARWKMGYPAPLSAFQQRAEHLYGLRVEKISRRLEVIRNFQKGGGL